MPWLKLWIESLHDPKLTRLTLAERGAWWCLVILAQECDAGGKIISGNHALDVDEIADAVHVKTGDDRLALESMLAKMEERGSLRQNSGVLMVVNLTKRQGQRLSERREAVSERVRRHRERQKQEKEDDGTVIQPETAESNGAPTVLAGENKGVPQATAQDKGVLAIWSGVKNFTEDSKGATRFLYQLREEFPDVDILEQSKLWAAAKLSKPLTRGSMPFKQLHVWMMKAREYHQTIPAGKDAGRYTKGKYGQLVHR